MAAMPSRSLAPPTPRDAVGPDVPIIEGRRISKHFGHVVALKDVDFKLWPNEVLGVVGDNGAGKSTLMKILSGVHPASSGQMLVGGTPVRFSNPGDARRLGIEMVYQDLALAGNMRIDENIFLGREQTRGIGRFRLVDHNSPFLTAMFDGEVRSWNFSHRLHRRLLGAGSWRRHRCRPPSARPGRRGRPR